MKRKQIIFGILAMGLIGVSLTLTARPVWAGPIPVTACNTHISSPGTYQLANSLSNCPKNGVVIEFVSGVTLDLNNHAISGNPASTTLGNGILIQDSANVTVTGPGLIDQFLRNINVQTSSNVTFTSTGPHPCCGILNGHAILNPSNPSSTGIAIVFGGASTAPLVVSNMEIRENSNSGVKITVAYGVVLNNVAIAINLNSGVDVGSNMHVDGDTIDWVTNGPGPGSTCDVKLRKGASASFTNNSPGHPIFGPCP